MNCNIVKYLNLKKVRNGLMMHEINYCAKKTICVKLKETNERQCILPFLFQ